MMHRKISFLMVLSHLLLTAFVVQWLLSQYNGEKENLKKNLYREFIDSRQQVMDSIIIVSLVEPILNDSNKFNVTLEINDDTLHDKKIIRRTVTETGSAPGASLKRKIVTENIIGPELPGEKINMMSANDSDILLQGVKMFVERIKASPLTGDSTRNIFYYKRDTMLFKKTVTDNFRKEGYPFTLLWMADSTTSLPHKKKGIYLESNLFQKTYGVEVESYRFYLFRKVWPQVLFGLALLLMTGAAFIISYRSLKRQMQLNALKNDFISNISHELKTPVSTVKVAIEAIQNFDAQADAQKTKEYLGMAGQEVSRLEMLINKVLHANVLEDEKYVLNKELTDLKLLVEEVVDNLKPAFSSSDSHVTIRVDGEHFFSSVDKLHVQGVLINLLDNSLKYATGKPEIKIKLFREGYDIHVTVSDNGPGIDPAYIDRVFEKFFRVPSGDRHNVKGYGLGLNYASAVMKKHGGSITVHNNAEGGCTFDLTWRAGV